MLRPLTRMMMFRRFKRVAWTCGKIGLHFGSSFDRRELAMRLHKIGGCDDGTCPTLFETDRGTYVVQGAIVTDPDALAAMKLPAYETAVEVPVELLTSLRD
jgi:hypothetical protein